METWLIWKLTGGKVHVTDYSNASRTMLFNIHTLQWDDEILEELGHPRMLCCRRSCPPAAFTARPTPASLAAPIPIAGAAGDQQAALFGQTCFDPGRGQKYIRHRLLHADEHRARSPCSQQNGLVTTIAWGLDGKVHYALEGSIFVAGAAIQWLRDELRLH